MSIRLVPHRTRWLIGAAIMILIAVIIALSLGQGRSKRASTDEVRILAPVPVAQLTKYAGNDACAVCHEKLFQSHAKSQHARAMARVTAQNQGALFHAPSDVPDPKRKILYRTGVIGDRCVLAAFSENGAQSIAEAEYGFGSGRHCITYLGRQAGTPLELRLTYYADHKRWAFSPGQQLASRRAGIGMETGVIKTAETIEGCFVCHSTVIAKEDDRLLPETMMMGVGCETCHGPGKAHIEAKQHSDPRSLLVNLKKLSGQQISIRVCGQCHRSPVTEDLADSFNKSQLPRLQGLALSQSRCFTQSKGELSCLTCHDVHDQTPRPLSFHNARCISCHDAASADHPACPKAPTGNCVSCHMPAQTVGMPFDLRYRNHWIKVWSK